MAEAVPPNETDPTALQRFWLSKDGSQEGPFTREVVIEGLTTGQIGMGDYIFREGWNNWVPIKDVAEFNRPPAASVGTVLPTPDSTDPQARVVEQKSQRRNRKVNGKLWIAISASALGVVLGLLVFAFHKPIAPAGTSLVDESPMTGTLADRLSSDPNLEYFQRVRGALASHGFKYQSTSDKVMPSFVLHQFESGDVRASWLIDKNDGRTISMTITRKLPREADKARLDRSMNAFSLVTSAFVGLMSSREDFDSMCAWHMEELTTGEFANNEYGLRRKMVWNGIEAESEWRLLDGNVVRDTLGFKPSSIPVENNSTDTPGYKDPTVYK